MGCYLLRISVFTPFGKPLGEFGFRTDEVEVPFTFTVAGHSFTFRDGLVYYKDDPERAVYSIHNLHPADYEPRLLDNGETARLDVERQYKVEVHPRGKKCGQCCWFDHAAGQREFTRQTHQYANGNYCFTAIVAQYTAIEARTPGLSEQTVGWCSTRSDLVDSRSPACIGDFKKLPFWERLFGRRA